MVDADSWLHAYDGHSFMRKVKANGHVMVDSMPYYVKRPFVRQHVALRVDAQAGQFVVEANGREVQRLAIKGLGHGTLPFTTFLERLCAAARARRL